MGNSTFFYKSQNMIALAIMSVQKGNNVSMTNFKKGPSEVRPHFNKFKKGLL